MPDGAHVFAAAFAEAVKPKPQETVSQWSDKHRILSAKEASEFGQWRSSRVPFAIAIMDSLSDHDPVPDVVWMASTQVSKTSVGLNWIGETIDNTPAPMLWVLPTTDIGKRLAKSRLAPMIKESPRLAAKVAVEKSRDSSDTLSMKEFAGGFIVIGGANSPSSLAAMPIKKLFLDEIDKYPRNVGKSEDGGGEGDAVDLAEARQTTFWRRKCFKASSPTIKSLSRIAEEYAASSQGRYYVPCPHCHGKQVLLRENLQIPDGHPEKAAFICIHCSALIEHRFKTWMLERGEWIHARPELYNVKRGFHISAWYTPIGLGKSWGQLAARYLEVCKSPERLKVFINTVDGEVFEDPTEKFDWEELKQRAEPYALRTILPGYVMLTAGVDVQKDRIEVSVWAWGRFMRSHIVDAVVFMGDPLLDEVWQRLDEYLQKPIRNQFGLDLRILACAVDSGYLPDRVFAFTRPRRARNVFASRGASQSGKPIISRASKVDFKSGSGGVEKHGAEQWQVGTDTAKHEDFLRLSGDRQLNVPMDRTIRFSDALGDEFFRQFAAEVWDPHKRKFIQVHDRNEELDKRVYALAAAHHPNLRLHLLREHEWAAFESQLQPRSPSLFAADELPESSTPAPPVQTSAPAGRRVRSRGQA